MSDASQMDVSLTETSPKISDSTLIAPTVLAAALSATHADVALTPFCGRQTALHFRDLEEELASLTQGCGVFDLGWRAAIEVRGEDRLRWLSGMVTNAVQQLGEHEGNYSFFLNAQGRIQGDAFVYRDGERLLLDTSADQVETLMAHLDRFIIMDDVALEDMREQLTGIGLAGPRSAGVLAAIGVGVPEPTTTVPIRLHQTTAHEIPLMAVSYRDQDAVQNALYCAPTDVLRLWHLLQNAGAQSCGIRAVEGLRVLEGVPRYGVDLNDRDLPQETSQTRALNFNKGCYLGQEIVERIRSRGAVHRSLQHFLLDGDLPMLPAELSVEGIAAGRMTSAISTAAGTYGMGIVRGGALKKETPLTYNGGVASVLEKPRGG